MLTAVLAYSLLTSPQELQRPWRTRAEFGQRLQTLFQNNPIPAAQALAMFGPPDDVWSREEAAFVDYSFPPPIDAIWRYGCADHFAPASYGEIDIRDGVANHRSGTPGGSHYPDLPPEAKFQELFQILSSPRRDMLQVVRMVNTLTALGEKQALAVMHEYTPSDFILVLYLLYRMPIGDRLGLADRLNVLLVEDVPIASAEGSGFGTAAFGGWPSLDSAAKAFQEVGRFRMLPLRPPSDVRELARAFLSLKDQDLLRARMRLQELTSSLFADEEGFYPSSLEMFTKKLEGRDIRLDPVEYRFVRADGAMPREAFSSVEIFSLEHESGVKLYAKKADGRTRIILRRPVENPHVRAEFPNQGLVLSTLEGEARDAEGWNRGATGMNDVWLQLDAHTWRPLEKPLEVRITLGERLVYSGSIDFKEVPRENQPRPAKDLLGH